MSNLAYLPQPSAPDRTTEIIAANVRAEVARAGLKDGEFAIALGITPMSMSRRLSAGTPFTTAEVSRIAVYFGVPVGDFFIERTRPTPEPGEANMRPWDYKAGPRSLADFRAEKAARVAS